MSRSYSGTGDSGTLTDRLHDFLRVYYDDREGGPNQLAELAQGYPKEKRSISLKYRDLVQFDIDIADDFLREPDQMLEYLREAVRTYDYPVSMGERFDPDVHIVGLDQFEEDHQFSVGDVHTDRVNSMPYAVLRGQVSRTSQVKPLVKEATFECLRCGTTTTLPQHSFTDWQKPHECNGCDRQGPFSITDSVDEDFQLVRLQRPPEDARGGTQPATLDLRVTGDLVQRVTPGDRVRVGAALTKEYDEDSPTADILGDANAIETQETDYEDIDWEPHLEEIQNIASSGKAVQQVVDSIKPSHRGDANVKEAIALQMFGGVEKTLADGSEIRGQSHILLIGDPGTDKTGLLQYAADLSPRSVQTSGKSASAAGLTCAAVQTDFGDGGWTIEAGALVEATGGLCAIDEFDKIDEEDRKGANQAMSQGKITPAKAGIKNITLPAKTTVIAAANPKYGRFNPHESIGEQIALDPTVFSRFDLIFTMTDSPEKERDTELANHILDSHQDGAKLARGDSVPEESEATPEIDPEVLRAYIAYAKQNCIPVLTDEAKERLREFYVDVRSKGADEDSPVPVTARKLDALVRLAESSARMRLSETATADDAERVIEIVLQCLNDVGIDPETGEFDADIVETGTSKTQRDRVQLTKETIEQLELEHENGAPRDAVLDLMVDEGFTRTKVIGSIDKLKEKGAVYEASEGYLRPT